MDTAHHDRGANRCTTCTHRRSRTELSKQEQNKFKQLRNDMHKQTDALRLAVDTDSQDMVVEVSLS
jgi:NAD+--asparagine ADP-ribosyltransferase